jgi:hypothetical protein
MDSSILNKEIENTLSQLESGKAPFLIRRELRDKGISINDSRFISDYAQHKLIIKHSKQRVIRGICLLSLCFIFTLILFYLNSKIIYFAIFLNIYGMALIYDGWKDYKSEKQSFLQSQEVAKRMLRL